MTSISPFVYFTLMDHDRQIRLIELLPADHDEGITCNLFTVFLDHAPPYETLSYVWGDTRLTQPISVNGRELHITVHLEEALRHLRRTDKPRTIWADAICIDQSNNLEKGTQVDMMGEIYSHAVGGLVWLEDFRKEGLSAEDVSAGFDLIRKLASMRLQIEKEGLVLDPDIFSASKSNVLQILMANQWWERIWTIQEVVFPSATTIMWGSKSLPWTALEDVGEIISYWHSIGESNARFPEIIRGYFLSSQVTAITMYRNQQNSTDNSPLDVFWRFRYRKSTNPRDKIFALLSFLSDADKERLQLHADYSLSTAKLYQQVTLKLIRSLGNLKPVIGVRGEEHQVEGLASWAVDWVRVPGWYLSRYWDASFRYEWFSCDGGKEMFLEINDTESTISLQGCRVDIIRAVAGAPMQDSHDGELSPLRVISTIQQWRNILQLDYREDQGTPVEGSLEDAFWQTLAGGVITRGGEVVRRLTTADYPAFTKFCNLKHNPVCSCEIYETLRIMLVNQALFITQTGYIGIGPATVEVGDEVWIVAGSKVPFMLRPFVVNRMEVPSNVHHLFVGDGYVHGIMLGEFVRNTNLESQVIVVE